MSLMTKITAAVGLVICVAFSSGAYRMESKSGALQTAAQVLPAGVRVEEVKFGSDNLTLAGTLLLPKLDAGRRAPAVLIIGGAGPTLRDGVVFGKTAHRQYRELAEHLAARGFAVLRYDKRCTGASGCKPRSLFEDYITDAHAAVELLRKRTEVDASRIALFGHGEGGFFATVVAKPEEKIAAMVLASSPGRTLAKLLNDHVQRSFTEMGKSQAEINAYLNKIKRITNQLSLGHMENMAEPIDPNDELLNGLLRQPEYTISLMIDDPLQAIKTVRAPTLILQGRKDVQMSVKDAEYLEEELTRAEHRDVTVRLLPDVDYLLQTCKGAGTIKALSEPSQPVDPAVLSTVTDWLQKKLSIRP